MTPNSDPRKDSHLGKTKEMNTQRDRFELLSAYLDGEVTASERQQVRLWLETDPQTQQLYARLVKLREGFQSLPTPATQPAHRVADQVFSRLDRRRKNRAVLWGGGAIAALVVGAVSSLFAGYSPVPQLAQSPAPKATTTEPLMIAVNRPLIEIPKTSEATPQKSSPSPAMTRKEPANLE